MMIGEVKEMLVMTVKYPLQFERYPDWPIRFNQALAKAQKGVFEYGKNDCCTLISDAIEAMTDIDPMDDIRGAYWDEETADEVIALMSDGGDLFDLLTIRLGTAAPGARGRKGDVAFLNGACGLVIGRTALFHGSGGFGLTTISQIDYAFRIGE